MILIDAHLDLAMNALNWDRNLDLPVYEIREREQGMTQKGRGEGQRRFRRCAGARWQSLWLR